MTSLTLVVSEVMLQLAISSIGIGVLLDANQKSLSICI